MDRAIDQLITNVFEKRIRQARQLAQEFKSTQPTSGASGQLGYLIQNPADWDLITTLPATAPGNYVYVEWTVTYTADGSQKWPYAVPSTDLRINGTGSGNKLSKDPTSSQFTYGSVIRGEFDVYDVTTVEDEKVFKWVSQFYYTGAPTCYLKLRAQASSPGTISVARTG